MNKRLDLRALLADYFLCLGFLSQPFMNHTTSGEVEGVKGDISLPPQYHFHPLHRRLEIVRANAAESSPLHVGSSWTRTGNLWFPSASRSKH